MSWHWQPVPYLNTGTDGITEVAALVAVNALIWLFALLIAGNVVVWTVHGLAEVSRAFMRGWRSR